MVEHDGFSDWVGVSMVPYLVIVTCILAVFNPKTLFWTLKGLRQESLVMHIHV